MSEVMERLRNKMYGGKRERFEEIITYLTNPTVDGNEIPSSICEDDIKFALKYRDIPFNHTDYKRDELTRILATKGERWERNLDEWSSAYYCYSGRLRRYLRKLEIKPIEWRDDCAMFVLDEELLTALAAFTEVN